MISLVRRPLQAGLVAREPSDILTLLTSAPIYFLFIVTVSLNRS